MSGKKPDQSAAKVPSNASQKQEAPQSPKPVNQDLKLPPDDTSIETNEQQDLGILINLLNTKVPKLV